MTTRTTRPVLGTLEAAPSWLAARLRLLALGLALLRPIGLHRACMWKAWRLSYSVESKGGQTSASWRSGGLSQRQIVLQATPSASASLGQPAASGGAGTQATPALVSTHGTRRCPKVRVAAHSGDLASREASQLPVDLRVKAYTGALTLVFTKSLLPQYFTVAVNYRAMWAGNGKPTALPRVSTEMKIKPARSARLVVDVVVS